MKVYIVQGRGEVCGIFKSKVSAKAALRMAKRTLKMSGATDTSLLCIEEMRVR